MPTNSWKKFELRVARKLGGTRRGCHQSEGHCDIEHPFLAPECKLYAKPTWGTVTDALVQASESIEAKAGKIPLAIVKENHPAIKDRHAVVAMWLDDYMKLIERMNHGKSESQDENEAEAEAPDSEGQDGPEAAEGAP